MQREWWLGKWSCQAREIASYVIQKQTCAFLPVPVALPNGPCTERKTLILARGVEAGEREREIVLLGILLLNNMRHACVNAACRW